MGAMALFGVPPENFWPYITTRFDEEPSAFLYAYASNYQSLQYYRLDRDINDRIELVERIKKFIRYGFPPMFGFAVFSSIDQGGPTGEIPYPEPNDEFWGGHAVVAVGYDDNRRIFHNHSGRETRGALLIRNSWGVGWGCHGYGWLPYEYILQGMAVDSWSMIRAEWINTEQFGIADEIELPGMDWVQAIRQ
jgi:C1A family cysteine protease